MRFNTHGADSALNHRSGEEIVVLGPVDESTYDKFDIGSMYRVRFADGFEVDAFADEIEGVASIDNEKCPVCGSSNIRVDSIGFFPGGVIHHVDCRDCLSDWNEVYRFVKHEEIYDATKEQA